MSREPPKWYDNNADNPPWINALAKSVFWRRAKDTASTTPRPSSSR
jgi:hypothetical protein